MKLMQKLDLKQPDVIREIVVCNAVESLLFPLYIVVNSWCNKLASVGTFTLCQCKSSSVITMLCLLFGYISIVPVLDFMHRYIGVCKTKDPVSLSVYNECAVLWNASFSCHECL